MQITLQFCMHYNSNIILRYDLYFRTVHVVIFII